MHTAPEAIERAISEQPVAILLDLASSDVNILELTSGLKDRPETKDVPIVSFSVLTAGAVPSSGSDSSGESTPTQPLFEAITRALRAGPRAGKILIVEDDEDLGQVLMAMFQQHGIETYHARTGHQAIELAQRIAPNLLILDLVLPDGDGYAVVDWLRMHTRLRQLPLVLYTARELSDADRERLRLGQTIFLTKGRVNPEELAERIHELLDRIIIVKREGITEYDGEAGARRRR